MRLYLARHGNTFDPGQKVVWTGGDYDIPLVDKGIRQAHDLAEALARNRITPVDIYCGSLIRTREYADIIRHDLNLENRPVIDRRLNEIDYGHWTGLSTEEVAAKFGREDLDRWNHHSIWPRRSDWGGSETETAAQIKEFAEELAGRYAPAEPVVIVSSNGKLRYFLKLIPGEFERRIENQSFKVRTGNLCLLECTDNRYRLRFWNKTPDSL